jgi:hypothetical protein
MESNVTQYPALYLADQRILERRFAFWRRPADRAGIAPAAEMRQAFQLPLVGSRRNGR